jgi:protein-tyrosine phosphatase
LASQHEGSFKVVVDSAGTCDHHAGGTAHHGSIAVARKHGIDITDHRARKVRKSDFDEFDFVVAMDASNLRDLKRKCPQQHAHKLSLLLAHSERHRGEDVPDPYYGHPSFEVVYDIVEDGVRGFFSAVIATRSDA